MDQFETSIEFLNESIDIQTSIEMEANDKKTSNSDPSNLKSI